MKKRGKGDLVIPEIPTVNRGEQTVRYKGPITWELVPEEVKASESLAIFKHRMRNLELF